MFIRSITPLALLLTSTVTRAHPGHPTFDPNHIHASVAADPSALLALIAAAGAVAVVGRGAARRAFQRVRRKK